MQVIQTINDTIRILFSPIDEDFKLLDFLLVQEAGNKYLAQIIEIYDDKYDASQNVARVKLFFKVNDNGEVFSYDHFTPSKECEIRKIKRDEILTFVNEGKEALTIGIDHASEEPVDINLEFLKNNAVIFADKIEHSNNICAHFASTLSRYNKHSVIFDFTGTLEIKNSKKLVITKDIKLPLNFYTLNYVWEKGLSTASLETQAICREIFNEIQTYAKNTPEGFIPFENLLKVIEIQYKATPIVELTVLINKLKAYQKNNIFANLKKDFETLEKSVSENNITIIDFSELKTSWHKEFCDFAIRNIKDAFVFARLNETNSDVDLINFIYDKNPQIHFVASVSYSFSKMPHIIERADNFILLPTLNPRRDFGAANFELTSIASDECILFGQDSENFIFTIKNNRFSNNLNSAPKALKKIKLKTNSNVSSDTIKEKFKTGKSMLANDNLEENQAKEQVLTDEELEFFEQAEKMQEEEEKILAKKPEDGNVEKHYEEEKPEITQENKAQDIALQKDKSQEAQIPITEDEQSVSLDEEISLEEEILDEPVKNYQNEDTEEIENKTAQSDIENPILDEEIEIFEEETQNPDEQTISEIENKEDEIIEGTVLEDISEDNETQTNSAPDILEEQSQDAPEITAEEIQELDMPLSEEAPIGIDEATFDKEDIEEDLKIKQASFQNILEEESEQEQNPDKAESDEPFSLEALAAQSVEAAFSEVIDKEDEATVEKRILKDTQGKLVVDENVVIDLEKIKEHIDTENGSELPIFKNNSAKKEKTNFKAGDTVEHDKYGTGEVVKVINYANRSLLQINFKDVGKRLLDPDIANLRELKK